MQDPNKPLDDGRVRLPSVAPGMDRIAPNTLHDDDEKVRFLRDADKNQAEDDQAILSRARKRLERCIAAEADNRRDGVDDERFYSGDQWSPESRSRRNAERRPCQTVNRLPVLIKQVTNDQRQNRPEIDIHPVGDRGDIGVAQIYRGLIRHIERESHADQAYDTGFESGARIGWGYGRVTTEFESPDTFDQVICIERVPNTFSIYVDPDDLTLTGSDMQYAFVTEMIDRDDFKQQYPNADPMPWVMGGFGDSLRNWADQYNVRVAEYYEITKEPRELVQLDNGFEGWFDELNEETKRRYRVVQRRKSLVPKIVWYKLTAKDVLDRTPWLGQWIPIVRFVGDMMIIDGKVKYWGLVRFAKDPQRMLNYARSAETERVMLIPKAPYIIAEGQVEGYEDIWKQANNTSYPYLPYRATEIHGHAVPPPQRQAPVEVSAGVVNMSNEAAQDMLSTTGVRFDATLNERTYDESGRALRELRRSGDIGSFNLIDNCIQSKRRFGEILVDLIPKIYKRPGRVVTILRKDDTEEQVRVSPNLAGAPVQDQPNPVTNQIMRAFDPTHGKYSVTVTVGPSYATRRIETAESMMDFLRAIPTAAPIIADLVAKNQDWEGAEEIATRLAKTLPPGMNTPELRDIPPQVQALLTSLRQQVQMLTAERQQLQAAVADRNADRQLARDRINRTFEVQLLNVVQKAHAAADKLKSEDARSERDSLHELAGNVLDLYASLAKGTGENAAASPRAALPSSQPSQPSVSGAGLGPPIAGARQAPDGEWYVPDGTRPGKYLRVTPQGGSALA